MFSKILIKLIDQSIVPAISLVSVRIISLIMISYYLGIEFTLESGGFVYKTPGEYLYVNSYSTLTMIIFLALGVFYILLKSLIFHDSHITPNLTARLFSLRVSSFIQSSFDLYSQGTIWLSYLYLMLITSGVMAVFGFAFPWIFFCALAVTLVATVLFILDIEKELEIKDMDHQYPEDELVLNFGDLHE